MNKLAITLPWRHSTVKVVDGNAGKNFQCLRNSVESTFKLFHLALLILNLQTQVGITHLIGESE